jgi:putative membrane protein
MPDAKLPDDPTSDDLADTRTAWAEDRTMLANERTFAGWMRTGMACIALALALRALFGDTAYPLVAKGVSVVFIVVAIMIFWGAATRSRETQKRMNSHSVFEQSHKRMTLLAAILTAGAIATACILVVL